MKPMHSSKSLLSIATFAGLVGLAVLAAAPATAYTTCNSEGDCWHTDTRVHFPGVTFSFHDDKWADSHRSDTHYRWHEADNDHDWHHGYWARNEWHPGE
jgi:hypothetical protein